MLVLALIGATAVIAQIVLMRELIVVFGGNEMSLGIMLAVWLLWTALGSSALYRLAGSKGRPALVVGLLQVAAALLLPCTILLVRTSRNLLQAAPGEVLGPVPILLTALLSLSLFCSLCGWLFAAGARLLAHHTSSAATAGIGSMYLLEAAGSGIGGFVASFFLLSYLNSFQIALLTAVANLAAAIFLLLRAGWPRGLILLLLLLSLPALWLAGQHMDRRTISAQWPGFQLLAVRQSMYGNLTVLEKEGRRTLVENGIAVVSVPDPEAAEETVHFALLQHPAPRSLLLIGGGLNGSILQALQYPTMERVDYVELDPDILNLARRYFPAEWAAADPKVHLHSLDGRLFLKTTGQRFDAIILSLPDPQTAQLNRFYTREFFAEAAEKLTRDGVFGFQVHAAQDYISPALADLLSCLRATLRQVFAEVVVIPGETAHFLASNRPGMLTASAGELLARLRARRLRTSYIREYYLPFRMAPERLADLQRQLAPQPHTPVNSDFAPTAYYFDVVLWGSQFGASYRQTPARLARLPFPGILGATAGMLLSIALLWSWKQKRQLRRACAGLCVGTMGFTLIAVEMLLLLGFQALYGYVYHQLAILIAAFMSGMALGSWLSLRRVPGEGRAAWAQETRRLGFIQVLAAASPLLLYAILDALVALHSLVLLDIVSYGLFPALAALAGVLGGYQFPLANRIYFAGAEEAAIRPGRLYALDLVGACAGALLISAYLVPVFGFFKTALLIAVANLVPAAMAALAAGAAEIRPA